MVSIMSKVVEAAERITSRKRYALAVFRVMVWRTSKPSNFGCSR
jgi:hypothetical protein